MILQVAVRCCRGCICVPVSASVSLLSLLGYGIAASDVFSVACLAVREANQCCRLGHVPSAFLFLSQRIEQPSESVESRSRLPPMACRQMTTGMLLPRILSLTVGLCNKRREQTAAHSRRDISTLFLGIGLRVRNNREMRLHVR